MPGETKVREDLVCTGCGLTFEDFARQGRFACGECYNTFRPRLEAIMRKIHGSSLHRGPAPDQEPTRQSDTPVIPVREEERLEAELHKAVDCEDFERAAEIRDKLKMIRSGQTVEK
jgi:protein arginine kinase activator